MAEAFLFDMSKSILSQLSSPAIQEIGVWWNAKDELNKLEGTVTTIQAVLLDAEKQNQPSHQFKHWLGKLRHVLYDAEELVDDFSTEALRRQVIKENVVLPKEVRLFFSRSNQFVFGYKLGHKIKAIRETLDAIANDKQKFHFAVGRTETPSLGEGRDQIISLEERENASFLRERNVIGRESEKKEIIDSFLLKSNAEDRFPVLPIVGTGGLGKTALAKLVHDDEKVIRHFDVRMWVYVGYVDLSITEIKEIEQKAIKSAIDGNNSKLLEANVGAKKGLGEKEFKDVIGGKFFLLVLDDVWSENRTMWSNLENLWRNGTLESRIMVTTRSLTVAEMTSKLEPYKLGDLSFSDSLTLFVNIVFEGQEQKKQDVKTTVERISKGQELEEQHVAGHVKTIVEKCAGVPLAIKAIGNMLYFLNPETEWLPFVKSELSKYPQANNDIFPTLRLSYDYLSSPSTYLKCCFTYCKLFPKGYEIDVKTLVQLWIAQGYIKPSNSSESLEDVGLRYCKVLVSRSFLEKEKVDELGNLMSCKMHDIMHDLASFLKDEEIVIVSKLHSKIIKNNTYHVSSELFVLSEFLESLFQARKLRTFIFSRWKSELVFNVDQCNKICKKLKNLLVLELRKNELKKIPHSISNLKYLRYLDLSWSIEIKILPNSITRLINLQVLKLCYCWKLEELPKDINKLINLKHLDCEGCDRLKYMPRGLGQLTLLQTLPLFVLEAQNVCSCGCIRLHFIPCGLMDLLLWFVSGCMSPCSWASMCIGGPEELKELNSLTGSLKIRNVKYISECEAANLKEKQSLESLSVFWDYIVDEKRVKDEEMSLQGFHLPPKLKKLSIWGYKGERFPVWHEATTDFPQFSRLSNLDIDSCPNLNLETIPIPSKLQNLRVDGNIVATTFPIWLSSLTNLVEIHLSSFNRCEHLPPLDQIPTLRDIEITDFDNLEYIEIFGSSPTSFPSLNTLDLKNCGKLKGWRKKGEHHDDTSTTTSTADLPQFHSLSDLTIDNCPLLIWESFPPTPKLNKMMVSRYEVISFPRCWLPSLLTNTVKIQLKKWRRCKYLPPLDQIPSLQQLKISDFDDLEYIEFGSGPTFFPSLKKLELSSCQNLKGWRKEGDEEQLPQFPCLSELIITHCPNLISMPLFPTLDVKLELRNVNKESLVGPLSNLKELLIADIEDLQSLPTEWLRNLTSLQSLRIGDCPSLTHLPQEMQRLLEETCGNNKGVDWPNIAHIPNIKIDLNKVSSRKPLSIA